MSKNKSPKRIGMVLHQEYDIDARVRNYAESLALAGWQVDILSLEGHSTRRTDRPDGIHVISVPLKKSATSFAAYIVEYSIALFFFTIYLMVLFPFRHYRLIHVHNMPDFLIFSALLPRLFGVKLILDVHDPMPEFYQAKFRLEGSKIINLLKLEEKICISLVDAVITANIFFKERLITRNTPEEKITVINNLADPRIFDRKRYQEDQHQKDKFVLLYPGTLAPRYGLDIAIRSAVFLKSEIPELLIRIVGPQSDYGEELKRLTRELGVEGVVEILPAVPVEHVPELIAQADLGIYPAIPDAHMSIATPGKVLEFAAMGKPVVASRLPVLERLFPQGSIRFFEAGSVEQFGEAVLDLYRSPGLRNQLVTAMDRGFTQIESWQREQARYHALLERMMQ